MRELATVHGLAYAFGGVHLFWAAARRFDLEKGRAPAGAR